ncbi:Arc family DNA-binding protein [Alloalcanivorax gelatiniphagus]|uniref:Arc family DNA-binding protein n=1 Tax=Alloalcanivorax gelatiniphagus TaxID=1194167 RepID=A0ABY2XMI3_9GAMM|nr:Arc family DNA-binding protein [Alloalcanivorax gelatiniphagus]TMW12600.1 Arc family DNA-binding protein [Alloalcanivorax gelatiniphagus]|tara:strand:- start:10927 stop:11199 length:273 start_codon:yes stop_codon:yes gene_type:complete
MKQDATSQAQKFVVRFPCDMRGRIAEVAALNHRSMNAEIVARLQHSLANWSTLEPTTADAIPVGREEQVLLQRFRLLSPARQRALLGLLD